MCNHDVYVCVCVLSQPLLVAAVKLTPGILSRPPKGRGNPDARRPPPPPKLAERVVAFKLPPRPPHNLGEPV